MASPRVVGLAAFVVELPLKRAVRHASHIRTSTDNLVVVCQLSDGSTGYGEGVPREYVTGESADSACDLLRDADLKPLHAPCPDFAAAVRLAEAIRLPRVVDDDRECQGNAARCALELSLLDAYGKAFGEPLSAVTELLTPTLYQFREKVQYSGVVTSARGLKLRGVVAGYRLTGFSQIKIKVGIEGYDDRKRSRTIRRWAGRRMGLRVDANEAWDPLTAAERIRELEPVGIESVEQPVPHEKASTLRELRSQVSTPIMLDESLCGVIDARRAIDGGWCDRFNIRLSKCGGFIPSLRLVELARGAGILCQLGCQVGESAILTAAGRHFATSVPGLTACEGSYDRYLVGETLAAGDLTFGRGGWAGALSGSGHGAAVDPVAIDRRARRQEVLLG